MWFVLIFVGLVFVVSVIVSFMCLIDPEGRMIRYIKYGLLSAAVSLLVFIYLCFKV